MFGSESGEAGKVPAMVKEILPAGQSPIVGTEYSVDLKYDLVVVASPKYASSSTDFEFTFKVDGMPLPYYELLFEWIKQQSDPELFFWIYGGGAFLAVICLIGLPIGCCCGRMMKGKKNNQPAAHN